MTDTPTYTTPIVKEEDFDHKEKQAIYEIDRAKHTADKQITRNHVAEFNGA